MEQVSDAQLARYAELIHTRTGIRVLPQKKILLSNRLRRRLRSIRGEEFRGLLSPPQATAAAGSGVGRLLPGNHHARDVSLPRQGPLGLAPQRLLAGAFGLGADDRQGWLACGSGRPRAARATRRRPRPAASPPACPTSSGGRFAFSGRISAWGRWNRPPRPRSDNGRCTWCPKIIAALLHQGQRQRGLAGSASHHRYADFSPT